jgi:hypothetical protein
MAKLPHWAEPAGAPHEIRFAKAFELPIIGEQVKHRRGRPGIQQGRHRLREIHPALGQGAIGENSRMKMSLR